MAHPRRALSLLLLLLLLPLPALCQPAPLPLEESDLALTVGDAAYALNTPAKPLLDALKQAGVTLALTEADSCLFAGKDKEYADDHLIIGTLPKGDKGADIVETLMVVGGDYVTRRGISLGDSREDVLDAYGEPFQDAYGQMVYALHDGPLSPLLVFDIEPEGMTVVSFYMIYNTQG